MILIFTDINYDALLKNMSGADILKVIAFQVGQILGLFDNIELYTKADIAETYAELRPFLYRNGIDKDDLEILQKYINNIIQKLEKIQITENNNICHFIDDNITIDIQKEIIINNI